MISTENSDDLGSSCNGGTSSSGEEIIATSKIGGGDGPITVNSVHPKSTRSSSIRISEKRNYKKSKKLLTSKISGLNSTSQKRNSNNIINSTIALTKIPRPSSVHEDKLNNIIGKNLNYKVEIEKADCFLKPQEKLKYYMCAQRNFKSRKSFSQMDINHLKYIGRQSREMVPMNYKIKQEGDHVTSTVLAERSSLMLTEDYYNFIRDTEKDEIDAKVAGMKVFATIMLNAWRRRRDDVKRLNDEVIRARKSAIKVKNQIHVLNSLFKIEQKQNDELNLRLRRMMEDQRKIHDLYEELNNSFLDLKTSNALLSDTLLSKDRDIEGMEMLLKDTKSRVFKLMVQERELENNLSNEQRKVQELQNNKNELMTNITQLQFELCEKQVAMKEFIYIKDEEVSKSNNQLHHLQIKITELKRCENERDTVLQELERIENLQKNEILLLQNKINTMNIKINSFLPNRIKNSWMATKLPIQTFEFIHLVSFYLLPAVPPPMHQKFPGFGFKSAFSYVFGEVK